MRIVLLCHNYPPHPGGLEVMVRALASGLAENNEVSVITSAYAGRRGDAVEGHVRVLRLPAIHLLERLSVPYPIPLGPDLRLARRILRSADLLHAHGALYLTSLAAARERNRRAVPLVITEHVGFVQYSSGILNRIQRAAWGTLGRHALRSADAIAVCSQRVFDELQPRQDLKRLQLIPNGVDTALFHPLSPAERHAARERFGLPLGDMLVLFAGRDSEKKNLPAVLSVPRKGFRLVVCGAERRLPEDVINLGLVPHDAMAELYGAADLLVHAASGEGFPLAVQEAIATGLPTVLYWDRGYERLLSRETVLAVDSLRDLPGAIDALVRDPVTKARLSSVGRDWAQRNWSWQKTVRAYEQLYDDLRATGR